jgi:AraC-like DNA-binding protein
MWTASVIAAASREDADAESLSAISGVTLSDARQFADKRVSEALHLRTWEAAMKHLRDPGFPVRQGGTFSMDQYDVLGLACKTATSLGEALERVARFLHIWTNTVECRVRDNGEVLRIELLREGERTLGMRTANEGAVAEVLNAVQRLLGQSVRAQLASFRHAAPSDVATHRALLGPLCFDASFDGIDIDERYDRPLVLSDPGLSRFLDAQLAARQREPSPSFARRVGDAIGDALPNGRPSVAQIAGVLATSPRTLQRRLTSERTSFGDLVTQVRRDLARELLRAGRPIAEVAFLVGYSEPSVFHRAFRGWFGETPGQYRGD